ncbi:DUF4258 domain-containing protein [Namhaeicola litoreus]|uniref:DUF4258 domain-containing protein n=1 Tax=Namhaeicola litoreus TaxID=1052145 RepID=A0ABW3Y370_9FLAO
MKYRFTLYGFGFAIGILFVFFFLGGKKASCNWLPNDRMLSIIRSKHLLYSDEVKKSLVLERIDTLVIQQILLKGDIDFSKSNVKNNPCRQYHIEGNRELKDLILQVQLCDSIATILSIEKVVK